MTLANTEMIAVFMVLFAVFVILGFWASRFRRGDLSDLGEWSLAGRRLGVYLAWFLVGADLYTAYTFIAIPGALFFKGDIYFFAVPYVGIAFGVALITMPRLWKISRKKNYVTAVDMIHDRYNSKTLTIIIALTGIVAELPYIALQIYGMQAVLTVMIGQSVTADVGVISEIALIIAFIILAAFTFTSGLRGATVTAVMKDAIIFVTVIVVIIAVPLAIKNGFAGATSTATTTSLALLGSTKEFTVLPGLLVNGFISLAVMSAFALYLYPHAINGILSTNSAKRLRYSTALLPLYGIGLALLALFGILAYASAGAMHIIAPNFNTSTNSWGTTPTSDQIVNNVLTVPALIYAEFPGWFAGFAFLGIFIGGLVPASIMAISQANLLTRNVVKYFKPDITPAGEARLSKWASVVFKFLALFFIFVISASSALQLQLLGGIIVLQTLPAIFLTMYTNKLNKYGLVAGWVGGIALGLYLVLAANKFGKLSTSLYNFGHPFSFMFVGLAALAINLLLVLVVSFATGSLKQPPLSEVQG